MATRIPFTESQWEELENQALVFKYIAAGVPVPSHLLFLIRRPFLLSSAPTLSPHFGWNVYEMGTRRKVDAEPGRCRRTDGKKWRCSKEAYPDSKYCERHMHRGKNRSSSSRKPPPSPQFSVPSLFLDSSLSSSSRVRARGSGYVEEPSGSLKSCSRSAMEQDQESHTNNNNNREKHCFILGTDLGRPLMEKKEREDYGEEEEQRSKRVYRFIDECPSSSVSTSLFM